MSETAQNDIRRLLKTFGIEADQAVTAHLLQDLPVDRLRIRITLTDLTDYRENQPGEPLELSVEGTVRTTD
jgi:hypothetical protein